MSGRKRSLIDFDDFSDKKQDEVTDKSNTNTEQSIVTETHNNEPEQLDELHNTDHENTEDSLKRLPELEHGFFEVLQEKKKPTVEETHRRQTFLIRNELINQLDELAKGKDRGFKTQLVNYAIERIINEILHKYS